MVPKCPRSSNSNFWTKINFHLEMLPGPTPVVVTCLPGPPSAVSLDPAMSRHRNHRSHGRKRESESAMPEQPTKFERNEFKLVPTHISLSIRRHAPARPGLQLHQRAQVHGTELIEQAYLDNWVRDYFCAFQYFTYLSKYLYVSFYFPTFCTYYLRDSDKRERQRRP